jgi:hypothetical protein
MMQENENKVETITNLQKKIIKEHLFDMHSRATAIIEETSYLMANFTAIKMILDNTTEISIKN